MRPRLAISGALACALLGAADLTVLNTHLLPALRAAQAETRLAAATTPGAATPLAAEPPAASPASTRTTETKTEPSAPPMGATVSAEASPTPAEASPAGAEASPTPAEASPTPAEASSSATQDLALTIEFDTDGSILSPAARADLRRFVSRIGARGGIRLAVDGHADRRGPPELNRWLSLARASAVRDELEHLGLERRSIDVHAHGASQPKVEGASTEALARNRRVELHVIRGVGP